jgi:iron complex transport system substrate-binding protein
MKTLYIFLLLLCFTCPLIAGAASLRFTDCTGRVIELARPPQRVFIAGKAGFMITNAVFLLSNAADKLVSYSKSFQYQDAEEFYRLVDDDYEQRRFTDHLTGIEEIAALKPDLVLARDFERSRLERGFDQLGIPVAFFNLEAPEAYYFDLKNLGIIFDEKARAEHIVNFYRSWHSRIKAQVENAKHKPTVLLLFYTERGGAVSFSSPPRHWLQAKMIADAGGIPVWRDMPVSQGWQQISFEQIAAWNPDYIMITSYYTDLNKAVEELKSSSMWQQLKAVKNEQLLAFPKDYLSWDQPDSRWILGQAWIASVLNPGSTKLPSLMQKLFVEFFALYGIAAETSKSIKVDGDYF